MNSYNIKFKFYNKKMQATIKASSANEAIEILKNKIEIIKINEKDSNVEKLKKIFNMR